MKFECDQCFKVGKCRCSRCHGKFKKQNDCEGKNCYFDCGMPCSEFIPAWPITGVFSNNIDGKMMNRITSQVYFFRMSLADKLALLLQK